LEISRRYRRSKLKDKDLPPELLSLSLSDVFFFIMEDSLKNSTDLPTALGQEMALFPNTTAHGSEAVFPFSFLDGTKPTRGLR